MEQFYLCSATIIGVYKVDDFTFSFQAHFVLKPVSGKLDVDYGPWWMHLLDNNTEGQQRGKDWTHMEKMARCEKKRQVGQWQRKGERWCSICLKSPRLCCRLMTPPNVHLRSSLFRWALCRLVTDRHTWWPDDNKQTQETWRATTNVTQTHKRHGSNGRTTWKQQSKTW